MAMIPAIITGITDFMINSGLRTAEAEIPTPAFAVPYDAPKAFYFKCYGQSIIFQKMCFINLPVKTMADVAPIAPKNELYAGHLSFVIKPIFDFKKKEKSLLKINKNLN